MYVHFNLVSPNDLREEELKFHNKENKQSNSISNLSTLRIGSIDNLIYLMLSNEIVVINNSTEAINPIQRFCK